MKRAAARFTLIGCLIGWAPQVLANDLQVVMDEYLAAAHTALFALSDAETDLKVVNDNIGIMLEKAKPVLIAFAGKNPDCAEQMKRLEELYVQLDIWTAKEIGINIDVGLALPKASGCQKGRSIVARPAMAAAIIRAEEVNSSLKAEAANHLASAIRRMNDLSSLLTQ
jgi:hypothetical protein